MSHTQTLYPRWILTVTALFLLAAAPLAAGESRWYLNGKIGEANLDAQFGARHPKFFDGSDETGSIEVGYVLHRYLAVQAGYHDLGTYQGIGSPCSERTEGCIEALAFPNPNLSLCVEGATDPICTGSLIAVPLTADVSGLSLSLVPRWPIGERFSLYGKVGVIDWDNDVSGGFGFGRLDRFSDRDLLTGLGVQYAFSKGLGVLVEYQRLDFDHDSTSLGASWRF